MDATAPRRSGIVLAGGRSRRMGSPKALLDVGGEPLVCRVARRLVVACDELVIVAPALTGRSTGEHDALAAAVLRLGDELPAGALRTVHDGAPDRGPVAGLAAGLAAARGERAFVAACDTPFLAPALVAGLFATAEGEPAADVVIARTAGGVEPMVAVYRVATMAAHYARQLADGELRPTARFAACRVREVAGAELAALDPEGASFAGVNDPDEYRAALARLRAVD
ncbi:MAG TPA: molybdenum cofactor guanylyltransferase [Candidatus Binatia bacterium]|nr:molybdenum cofactor guanylyltransferase [Candidatus Binatia bacterium]